MDNKKTLLLTAGVLVVLLGGASLLYSRLGGTVNREMLQTEAAGSAGKESVQPGRAGDGEESQAGASVGIGGENQTGESAGDGGGSRTGESARDGEESQAGEPAGSGDSSREDGPGEQESKPQAPDFTVQDGEGNPVRLSDFVGKPVVLNFWASWCPPCKSEMPDFEEAFSQYGEDIHFLMVNLTDGSRETVETAENYVEEKGYTFPVYFDTQSEAAMVYGIMAVPATFFLDAEGKPVARASGAIDKETLEKGLEMIWPEGMKAQAQ